VSPMHCMRTARTDFFFDGQSRTARTPRVSWARLACALRNDENDKRKEIKRKR